MSFGDEDFDSWRRRRARPGAVLADGSTSVLAENDLLGSTVDPDEFESWRAGNVAADRGRQEYRALADRPSIWDAPDPDRGFAGNAIDYLTERSWLPGARFVPMESPEDASGLRRGLDTTANIIGGLLDSATTPAGAATMVSGYGLGKGAVDGGGKILGPLLRGAERAGSAAYAGAGVEKMLGAESFADLGTGAVEALLGYVGARTPGPAKSAPAVDRKLLGAALDDGDLFEPFSGSGEWTWGPDLPPAPGATAAEPWGSFQRSRQIPRDAEAGIVDADPALVPPAQMAGGTRGALPPSEGANALYPAALPPHGPIPLRAPATPRERPDLLSDSDLLGELDRALKGGNVDEFRTFLDELEGRGTRGALSNDPLVAPPPPAGPSAGAPASAAPAARRRGRVSEPPAAPVSEADEIQAALDALKVRAGQISTRYMPEPVATPIEARPIASRTTAAPVPGPEFAPVEPIQPGAAAAMDPLDELEELIGVGASREDLAERAYQQVLGKYRAGEELQTSGRVLDDMSGVRDARMAARTAVDNVEDGYGSSGVTEGAQRGGGAAEHPAVSGRGVDVPGSVPDRAVGGENRSPAVVLGEADEAYFQELLADARAAGFTGHDDELRSAVEGGRAYIDEQRAIDFEHGDRGILQAIADLGGISAKAETGMSGEIDALQRALGGEKTATGFNKRTGERLKSTFDSEVRVPGIKGPIVTRLNPKSLEQRQFGATHGIAVKKPGVTLDEATQRLNELGFDVSMEELTDILATAADRVRANPGPSIQSVMEGAFGVRPGTKWWEAGQAADVDPLDELMDLLDTGEAQPRLPGAGNVRASEIATPEVAEAPFALGRQADTTPDALERDLFAAPAQADVPRGTSQLARVPTDPLDELAEVSAPSTFEALPANVRSYLTKRLGWTPEEINALDVDTAIAHGRDQVRPPRAEPSPETRAAAEGRMAVTRARSQAAEDELLTELERFFEIEQPLRAARAQARAIEARTPVAKKLETGKIIPKAEVNKAIDRNIEVAQEMGRDREAAARMAAMSESEKKAHSSRVAGEHRQIDREIERAWADPNPSPDRMDKIARLYNEQAEAFLKGQLKGGTGKELSNDELAKKFTTLYGGIPIADPELWKAFFNAVKTQPAVRTMVGGLVGYNVDDEDGFRGALYGMALAAAVPAGAKALARSFRQARAGRNPWPIIDAPGSDKDISFLRAYLPFAPERTVPEVFNKVNEQITKLQAMWEGTYPGDFAHLEKLSKKQMADEIRVAAKAAETAGQTRKAWYLDKMANGMEGRLTMGQRAVKEVGRSLGKSLPREAAETQARSLRKQAASAAPDEAKRLRAKAADLERRKAFAGNEVERHLTGNIYRVLIGWALDSAAKNTTQPILSTLYVSPKSLTTAYKLSRTPAAKKMAERFDLNIKNIAELADTAIVNKAVPKARKAIEKVEELASAPIRVTDNFNRRVVLMAALEQEGKLQQALAGKLALNDPAVMKAMSIVRKTQGHTGPMGSHPLYRGPLMGSIKPFTKFPFLFIDNVLSAFQDPEARGAQFVATIMGAALVGRLFGLDTEDLFLSGGRPLNLDLSHPQSTAREIASGKSFPATRAAVDAKAHFTGDADHPVTEDLATLALSRYPMKVGKAVGHIVNQGMGTHRTAAGTGVEHDGMDDLLGLAGLRTTARGDKIRAREEQYEFTDRARRKATSDKRELREDWREAWEAGDEEALAELEALMSPQQRRQLRREAEQTPDERMRRRVPKDLRPDFERRFGGQ